LGLPIFEPVILEESWIEIFPKLTIAIVKLVNSYWERIVGLSSEILDSLIAY
jgi:hypothetical protein